MGTKHKHHDLIVAWAAGADIECRDPGRKWQQATSPTWYEDVEYRIKPEAPKWPTTRMTGDEMMHIFDSAPTKVKGIKAVHIAFEALSNAAIARACEDGDVVPAAMLEKVANEVWDSARSYPETVLPMAKSIHGTAIIAGIIKAICKAE